MFIKLDVVNINERKIFKIRKKKEIKKKDQLIAIHLKMAE